MHILHYIIKRFGKSISKVVNFVNSVLGLKQKSLFQCIILFYVFSLLPGLFIGGILALLLAAVMLMGAVYYRRRRLKLNELRKLQAMTTTPNSPALQAPDMTRSHMKSTEIGQQSSFSKFVTSPTSASSNNRNKPSKTRTKQSLPASIKNNASVETKSIRSGATTSHMSRHSLRSRRSHKSKKRKKSNDH